MAFRNAPTGLMKTLGYGRGYRYDHDVVGGVAGQCVLPEELAGQVFYKPSGRGFEKDLEQRLDAVRRAAASEGGD